MPLCDPFVTHYGMTPKIEFYVDGLVKSTAIGRVQHVGKFFIDEMRRLLGTWLWPISGPFRARPRRLLGVGYNSEHGVRVVENSVLTIAVQEDDESGFIPSPKFHKIAYRGPTEATIYVREIENPASLMQGVGVIRSATSPLRFCISLPAKFSSNLRTIFSASADTATSIYVANVAGLEKKTPLDPIPSNRE